MCGKLIKNEMSEKSDIWDWVEEEDFNFLMRNGLGDNFDFLYKFFLSF